MTRKTRNIGFLTAALVIAVALIAVLPRTITSTALGDGWSCKQNAFITACKPV